MILLTIYILRLYDRSKKKTNEAYFYTFTKKIFTLTPQVSVSEIRLQLFNNT